MSQTLARAGPPGGKKKIAAAVLGAAVRQPPARDRRAYVKQFRTLASALRGLADWLEQPA